MFQRSVLLFLRGDPKQGLRHIGLCSDCEPIALRWKLYYRLLRSFCVQEKFETPPFAERAVIGGFISTNFYVQRRVLVPRTLPVCIIYLLQHNFTTS